MAERVGAVRCSACGRTFEALSRAHGRRRAFVYRCATHRRKGACICANALVAPMVEADLAVLDAVESTLLDPAVVRVALDHAIAALEAENSPDRREAIEADLMTVDLAVNQLTAAIAQGGELGPLVDALRNPRGQSSRCSADCGQIRGVIAPFLLDRHGTRRRVLGVSPRSLVANVLVSRADASLAWQVAEPQ